jgi:hypothetical protein
MSKRMPFATSNVAIAMSMGPLLWLHRRARKQLPWGTELNITHENGQNVMNVLVV